MRAATTVTALIVVAFAVGVLATVVPATAQPVEKVYRVGWLALAPRSDPSSVDFLAAFLRRLRELGYVEGRNLILEARWAEGDAQRLPGLAAELVRSGVDVIVAPSTPPVIAAMRATRTIPIVMWNVGSPVERGVVASLARPGGNVTGLTSDVGAGIFGKRLELLKEAVPRLSRVVFLADPTLEVPATWKVIQGAAQLLGLTLQRVEAGAPGDFDPAFAAVTRMRPDALYVQGGPFHFTHRARIAEFAAGRRLPTMHNMRSYVEAGGLMAYGPSFTDLSARAGTYVHKILNGAWPGDLPVERPTKFELIINLKTAKTLGLTIPQSLLSRADEVIR